MDLKQGTRVEYDIQTLKGKGTVVGVAVVDQPICGKCYIVQPDEPIRNEVYDYTHFVAWEIQLKTI